MNGPTHTPNITDVNRTMANGQQITIKVIKAEKHQPTQPTGLLVLDFDKTTVNNHMHSYFTTMRLPQTEENVKQFLTNSGAKGAQELKNSVQQQRDIGGATAIASFSLYPQAIKMALTEILGPELSKEVTITTCNDQAIINKRNTTGKNAMIDYLREELHVDAKENTLLVDDSANNITAAEQAGYKVAHVSTKHNNTEHFPKIEQFQSEIRAKTKTENIYMNTQDLSPDNVYINIQDASSNKDTKQEPIYMNTADLHTNHPSVEQEEPKPTVTNSEQKTQPGLIARISQTLQKLFTSLSNMLNNLSNRNTKQYKSEEPVTNDFDNLANITHHEEAQSQAGSKTPEVRKTTDITQQSTPTNQLNSIDLKQVNSIRSIIMKKDGTKHNDAIKSLVKASFVNEANKLGIDTQADKGKLTVNFPNPITIEQGNKILTAITEDLNIIQELQQNNYLKEAQKIDRESLKTQLSNAITEIKATNKQEGLTTKKAVSKFMQSQNQAPDTSHDIEQKGKNKKAAKGKAKNELQIQITLDNSEGITPQKTPKGTRQASTRCRG